MIKRLLAIIGLAVMALAAEAIGFATRPAEAAGPNDCQPSAIVYDSGWKEGIVRCWSVQDADRMYRVVVRMYRRDTDTFYTLRGEWESCDGYRSDVAVPPWDEWISISWRVVDDTKIDGC